jgi:uncharacterized membrane protein YeaQ/YmgE (transglycosylase-associated protein family)
MSVGQVVVYVVIAVLCGAVGQLLVGRSVGGFVVSFVVGVLGSLVGGYLARVLRVPDPFRVAVGGKSIPVLWAIVGASLVTLVVALMQRIARGSGSGR